ncbi:hypothetical protein [Variovorax guangxiensis]|uniref:hypothetical protein n=1 Tax=Variovorax guangxiensis TaxID=1775474 RepID=UPI00197ED1BF|nr:hypothetical protein [Variovorax guangxiensis]
MKALAVFIALVALGPTWAKTPSILLEACNAMEPLSKRQECLRAANDLGRGGSSTGSTTMQQPLYSRTNSRAAALSSNGNYKVGSRTCHVGPRGGTYTITASGRKNYNGC